MSFVESSLPETHEMQSMTKNTVKTLVNAAKEACMPLPENPQINQFTRLSLRALQARHVAINTANVSRLNSSLNLMLVTWMMALEGYFCQKLGCITTLICSRFVRMFQDLYLLQFQFQ